MKKYILPFCLAISFLSMQLPTQGQDIVNSIPAPGLRCQDVAWDGTNLWVTDNTSRMYYQVDPEDGTILHEITFPTQAPFSEGITYDGQYLWATGWQESNGEGSKIYKIDTEAGDILESFDYPEGTEDNWPHGLTFDGNHLWANNFNSNTLDKIDPMTGNLLTTIPAPGSYSIGIAWDGNYLWTDDFHQGKIFKHDPYSGEVLGEEYIMVTNMRGLTWDGEYLWCASWEDQRIYQIDVGPLSISEPDQPSFCLHPNPSKGVLYLESILADHSLMHIQVFDIQGKQMTEIERSGKQIGPQGMILDLSGLPGGIYMIRVITSKEMWSEKVVLRK